MQLNGERVCKTPLLRPRHFADYQACWAARAASWTFSGLVADHSPLPPSNGRRIDIPCSELATRRR